MMDRYKNMPPGWHPPMARPHQDPYGPVREPLPMSLETQALLDMLMGTEKIGLDPQESWPQGQISLKQQEQFEGTVPPPGGFIGKLGKLLKPNFKKRYKPQHNLYDEADKKAKDAADKRAEKFEDEIGAEKAKRRADDDDVDQARWKKQRQEAREKVDGKEDGGIKETDFSKDKPSHDLYQKTHKKDEEVYMQGQIEKMEAKKAKEIQHEMDIEELQLGVKSEAEMKAWKAEADMIFNSRRVERAKNRVKDDEFKAAKAKHPDYSDDETDIVKLLTQRQSATEKMDNLGDVWSKSMTREDHVKWSASRAIPRRLDKEIKNALREIDLDSKLRLDPVVREILGIP